QHWPETAPHLDALGGFEEMTLTATARAALRSGSGPSPAATLAHATATLSHDLAATDTFVTALVATLGTEGHVTYADAGHGLAAVARASGGIERIERGTVPIGVGYGAEALDHVVTLEPGDLMLIHSDGLLELAGGPRTTASAAASIAGARTAAEALDRLAATIGNAPPPDDVTVLIIRRTSDD
ncbi:MAG: SpoIIE family protein phosphatase, partial [Solirubrobacteraceae bacterium]|nr:SpoIIE family protein phosphatase [Solirubrobacteraceae bacterium]